LFINPFIMPSLSKETVKKMIDDACDPLFEKISVLVIELALERDSSDKRETELIARDTSWYQRTDHLEKQIAEHEKALAAKELDFSRIVLLQEKMNLLERKCDDLDQYSRRVNLIVDGIPVHRNESPASILKAVHSEIHRLKLPIKDFQISRAHRSSSPYIDNYGVRQQAVIVRFAGWGARDTLYQARHDSKFRYRADLTYERQSSLTHARVKISSDIGVAAAIKYVFADKNCRMQASCTNGRLLSFSTAGEFDNLVNYLDTTDMNGKIDSHIFSKYKAPDNLKEDIKDWDNTLPPALQPRTTAVVSANKPTAEELQSFLEVVSSMTSPSPSSPSFSSAVQSPSASSSPDVSSPTKPLPL
jgi:hypothetical protein